MPACGLGFLWSRSRVGHHPCAHAAPALDTDMAAQLTVVIVVDW
jgi:hypothetical protein